MKEFNEIKRPIKGILIWLSPVLLFVIGTTGCSIFQPHGRISQNHSGSPDSLQAENDVIEQTADQEGADLASFELKMKKLAASGWTPPWKSLEIQFTDKQIKKMPTKELGIRLWTSGVHSRELFLYSNPDYAMKRLEIFYNGFSEFFSRPDMWEGLLAALDASASDLKASNPDRENIALIMNLTAIPEAYGYPPIKQSLAGHEKELIEAHISALLKLKTFVEEVSSRPPKNNVSKLVTPQTAVRLTQSAIGFGKVIAPDVAETAQEKMLLFKWSDVDLETAIPSYIEQSVSELREFSAAS